MKKIDPEVARASAYIALWTLILSVLMEGVFLVIGKWELSVLFGNLLGACAAVLNFFLMGLTVQRAVTKEEKEAKTTMRVSQLYRTLFLLVVAILGAVLAVFNIWATVIPLFFPRIAASFRSLFDKKG